MDKQVISEEIINELDPDELFVAIGLVDSLGIDTDEIDSVIKAQHALRLYMKKEQNKDKGSTKGPVITDTWDPSKVSL